MLDLKTIDLFAFRSGIADRTIIERDVILTYVLQILKEKKLLDRYAFKGGTCIRKVYLGSSGRFSMDLDFSAKEAIDPEDAILDLMEVLNEEYYDISFHLDDEWRMTQNGLSFTVEPTYSHAWNDSGGFQLQVSLREQPTLDIENKPLLPQSYYNDMEFNPPSIPCLNIVEIIAEKIRAAYQRVKIRDLYDLYCYSSKPYNRSLVRTLTVIKLWQVRDPFDPAKFLERLQSESYDWNDLKSLVSKNIEIRETDIINETVAAYSFLQELEDEEILLVEDASSHRLQSLHKSLIQKCESLDVEE